MGWFKKKVKAVGIKKVAGAKFSMGETVYRVSKNAGASEIRISKGKIAEITISPEYVRYWLKDASTGYESEIYGSFDEAVRALRKMFGETKASGASDV